MRILAAFSLLALSCLAADINAPGADGTTPLHWAVRSDDLAKVERLLAAGANPKAANRYGVTTADLKRWNRLPDLDLRAGQQLRITSDVAPARGSRQVSHRKQPTNGKSSRRESRADRARPHATVTRSPRGKAKPHEVVARRHGTRSADRQRSGTAIAQHEDDKGG